MKKKFNSKKQMLILAGSLFVIYLLANLQIEFYKENKAYKANQEKIIQMEKETQELTKAKQTYNSDENIEKEAREKLGYVKPGEKVYIDKSQQ